MRAMTNLYHKMKLFVIEDEFHAEPQGEFKNYNSAFEELERRTKIPWDEKPNKCPCSSWRDCHRHMQIVEYDTSSEPWEEINTTYIYSISSSGIEWAD